MRGLDRQFLIELCTTDKTYPRLEGDFLIVECQLGDGSRIELSLDIARETFYKLPEFSVNLKRHPRLAGLPHVGPSGGICSSDATKSQPNPERPEQCIKETLDRAIAVLDEGIAGSNYDDYAEELNAYWMMESTCFGYICDAFPSRAQTIYAAFAKIGRKKIPCFASSKQTAIEFAAHLGDHSNHTVDTIPCLFLQLSQPLSFPLPTTYREWDEEIGRSGKHTQNKYRSFLCESKRKKGFIILGVPSESRRYIAGFLQDKTPNYHGFRAKTPKRHERALKDLSYSKKKALKYHLENISQERLFNRGGSGQGLYGTFGIIGCGSLGSYLAKSLADAGASKFLLIDDEILGVENVARHACGFSYIGENKAQAMKKLLERDNPNVRCTSFVDDANLIIDDSPQLLNNSQTVFVTAADSPIEYHCVRALCNKTLTCPLVIMWVEPFALVAHAIVLNKPQDVINDMFDENLAFANPAILNSGDFLRREAGCQSSYMPYSGLDVQAFLHSFIRVWGSDTTIRKDRNYHFIWTGKLSAAGKLDATVASQYARMNDYSFSIERID